MKYFVILFLIGFVSMIATNPVLAQCAYDPNQPHSPCDDTHEFLILDSPRTQIENINGTFYDVSEPFTTNSFPSVEKIIFHNIEFSLPYRHFYPRYTYSDVIFSDGTEETLSVLWNYPAFTEHVKPQAGLVETHDGIKFLVSMNLRELSPRAQSEMGIKYLEIQCKDGLELVAKIPSAHPKCVKPESVEKLTMRGWATTNKTIELTNPTKYMIDKNGIPFEVQYSLKGAMLDGIAHDIDANSLRVALDNSVGGQMVILIPRELIDAKIGKNGIDDLFFLLIDGEENMYGEKTNKIERTITIWFPKNASDIEIIGVGWTYD